MNIFLSSEIRYTSVLALKRSFLQYSNVLRIVYRDKQVLDTLRKSED